MRIETAVTAFALLLAGCMPRQTRPLELGLDASAAIASGEEIGDPLGAGVRIGVDWLALSASGGRAEARRHGVPCAGLVGPDDPTCVEQPLHQDSEIVRVGVGYQTSKDSGRSRLTFTPYVGGAYLAQEERGLHTGGRREAAAGAWQVGALVGVQWNLVADLWLGLSADAALIMPIRFECDDCYDPFRESIGIGSLSFSAGWRLP